MFCMLLRKYCEGGIIEAVEQIGMERIIRLQIRHRDELGDISPKHIIVEIMGRHSNIILIDPAMDNDPRWHPSCNASYQLYRIVMPGSNYVSPPDQDKQNPL